MGKPEWDTIDGTFYVDEDGQPWKVFAHEWTSMPDKIGGMDGEWIQDGLLYEKGLRPEYTFDGGHAMIFKDKQGKMRLALHAPNYKFDENYEHLLLKELIDTNDTIDIK